MDILEINWRELSFLTIKLFENCLNFTKKTLLLVIGFDDLIKF